MERPFRVLGVQQVAIGGADKRALRKLWVDLLGLSPQGTYRNEAENVDEDICSLGRGVHAVEVDLMQPLDAARKPAVHVPPLARGVTPCASAHSPCHSSPSWRPHRQA